MIIRSIDHLRRTDGVANKRRREALNKKVEDLTKKRQVRILDVMPSDNPDYVQSVDDFVRKWERKDDTTKTKN